LPPVGAKRVSPAIPGVYFPFGVQEKDHQRQVVVEFEQVQVDAVEAGQPDANELVGEVFDAFETDYLPVKLPASNSRIAPQDHHERLGVFSRLGLAFLEAENPTVPERLRIQDHILGLSTPGSAAPGNDHKSYDVNDSALHENPKPPRRRTPPRHNCRIMDCLGI
jgi:hypothetical protein